MTLTRGQKRHLFQDLAVMAASVAFAIWFGGSDILDRFLEASAEMKWLESFIAGMFFTSAFTVAPAIAVLSKIADTHSLLSTAVFGGIGALAGDFVIFKFVRDRFSEDLKSLFSKNARERFAHIAHLKLFRWFLPFLAALIIASPLPDEFGVMILGFIHTRTLFFIPFSFLANFSGIFIITGIAKSLF